MLKPEKHKFFSFRGTLSSKPPTWALPWTLMDYTAKTNKQMCNTETSKTVQLAFHYFLFRRNSGHDVFNSHKVAPGFNWIPSLH